MTAPSPSDRPTDPPRGRTLPPRLTSEERAAAAGTPAHHRHGAGVPASPSYIPPVDRLLDDGLRAMIDRATAATVAHPARRWAPGATRATDRPVTGTLTPDVIATLRQLAATAADRAFDAGYNDDAWALHDAVAALDELEATRSQGRAA